MSTSNEDPCNIIGETFHVEKEIFRIESLLASGCCCFTYLAKNIQTKSIGKRWIAIKIFKKNVDYFKALQRELLVLSHLRGKKHIVQQYGYLKNPKELDGIAMELLSCCGTTLLNALTGSEVPSMWLLHTFATHAARGLCNLHEVAFAHGDIKLQNIMWSPDQAAFVLIDFGLSTYVNEEFRHRVHSIQYSSPEARLWHLHVITEDEKVPLTSDIVLSNSTAPIQRHELLRRFTTKEFSECQATDRPPRPCQPADIWALGCCIIMLVLQRPLFSEAIPNDQKELDCLVERSLREQCLKVSHYSENFVEELIHFVQRCFRLNPSERASADELSHSWTGVNPLKPSSFDRDMLPTCVLRLDGMSDHLSDQQIKQLVARASIAGKVVRHVYQPEGGRLYVVYEGPWQAQCAADELNDFVFNDNELTASFYPPELLLTLR